MNMKKFSAVFLAIALVFSLSSAVFSFAATADTAYPPDGTTWYPPGQEPRPREEESPVSVPESIPGFLICLMEDDTVYQFVPLDEVTNVPYAQADTLIPEKRVAFQEARDAAKAVEGTKLRQAFWFEVPESYTIDDEHYGKYLFACSGKDVEVTVNGNPMEVVSVTGRTTYFAKITERGALMIFSKS